MWITKLCFGPSTTKDIVPLIDHGELHQDNEGRGEVVEVVLAVFRPGKEGILEGRVSAL